MNKLILHIIFLLYLKLKNVMALKSDIVEIW